MPRVACTVPEYQPDGTIHLVRYAFEGTTAGGWEVRREGRPHLRLGPGYRLLAASHCGICATDLARRHLPFPLPQVTGHEVVARDESGAAVVVEINASCAARGLDRAAWCAHCERGMPTHCPARLVLGIHDLPGGFSPWLLAPAAAVLPVPAAIDPLTATLVEPFAAALGAVRALSPADGDRVLVLGPGRLGSLVVAALAAWRRRVGRRVAIVAAGRRQAALDRARALGADDVLALDARAAASAAAEVVVDTTGAPEGVALALRLATREVHLKSTSGRPALGLANPTALVVDEVTLAPWSPGDPPPPGTPPGATVMVRDGAPRTLCRALAAAGLRVVDAVEARALPLGGADLAVARGVREVDAILRPDPALERGLVRARGAVLVAGAGAGDDVTGLLRRRGLRLTTTRCGDFPSALEVLTDPALRGLGERLVTDVVPAIRLADAFARAAPGGGKVIVTHPRSLLPR